VEGNSRATISHDPTRESHRYCAESTVTKQVLYGTRALPENLEGSWISRDWILEGGWECKVCFCKLGWFRWLWWGGWIILHISMILLGCENVLRKWWISRSWKGIVVIVWQVDNNTASVENFANYDFDRMKHL
jgi:hypothetical protein